MGGGGDDNESEDEGLETECSRRALSWFITRYDFMVAVVKKKVRVKCEDEGAAEIRWKLCLLEKAILVWARLMEVMLMVGEIVGTVRSET